MEKTINQIHLQDSRGRAEAARIITVKTALYSTKECNLIRCHKWGKCSVSITDSFTL